MPFCPILMSWRMKEIIAFEITLHSNNVRKTRSCESKNSFPTFRFPFLFVAEPTSYFLITFSPRLSWSEKSDKTQPSLSGMHINFSDSDLVHVQVLLLEAVCKASISNLVPKDPFLFSYANVPKQIHLTYLLSLV